MHYKVIKNAHLIINSILDKANYKTPEVHAFYACKGSYMNALNHLALVATLSFGSIFNAIAQNTSQIMSKESYEQHYESFNADFQLTMQRCATLKNKFIKSITKQQCESHALINREIQKAELKASYKPTIENKYRANMVKAEMNFKMANEKCEMLLFSRESICMNAAKNQHGQDVAKARAQRNIEMNQAILKNKDLKLDKFNGSSNPFVSTDFKKPSKYMS